jgi:hypothetical protein
MIVGKQFGRPGRVSFIETIVASNVAGRVCP